MRMKKKTKQQNCWMFRRKRTEGILQYAQAFLSVNGSSSQSNPNAGQLLRREGESLKQLSTVSGEMVGGISQKKKPQENDCVISG